MTEIFSIAKYYIQKYDPVTLFLSRDPINQPASCKKVLVAKIDSLVLSWQHLVNTFPEIRSLTTSELDDGGMGTR